MIVKFKGEGARMQRIRILFICHGKNLKWRKKLGKSMGYRLCEAEFTRNLHVKLRCFLGCDMAKSERAILKCNFTLGLPFVLCKV